MKHTLTILTTLLLAPLAADAANNADDRSAIVAKMERSLPELPDRQITEAYQRAAVQNVLEAVNPKVFPGYWSVCADGQGFGYGNTYPSLDGHQMTDALLWLGYVEVVQANSARRTRLETRSVAVRSRSWTNQALLRRPVHDTFSPTDSGRPTD